MGTWIPENSAGGSAADTQRSLGRVFEDSWVHLPDPYEVDRHRVLQSTAFRRLEYKTQVFVTHEHDHFRTRLTHTLEVASLARRLAIALGANSVLAEVIALAHDLGHPPFGHAGEMALAELMADHGGFEHNAQSLRVVDYLEHPFPPFRGLNLTFETREGLAKHSSIFDRPGDSGIPPQTLESLRQTGPWPTLEGQVAGVADRLAYDSHDLEDALGAGLIGETDLSEIEAWREAADPVRDRFSDAPLAAVRRPILDRFTNTFVEDIVSETNTRRCGLGSVTAQQVRQASRATAAFSRDGENRLREVESFLAERVYRHRRLIRMDFKARFVVRRLFEVYVANPDLLPTRFSARIDEQGVRRVICDYLAGMTDRFCLDEYRRLFDPFERV